MFLMAATSHDYWLAFLAPRVWKALHMAVYVAYGLVVMHVALGAMQDKHPLLVPIMLIGGFGTVTALHIAAGRRERATDEGAAAAMTAGSRRRRRSPSPTRRPHRRRAGRRAHRGVSRRRRGSARSPISAPTRTARSAKAASSTARDLPLARLPVSTRGRLRAAAFHREARDTSRADQSRHGRGGPAAASAWDAGWVEVGGRGGMNGGAPNVRQRKRPGRGDRGAKKRCAISACMPN